MHNWLFLIFTYLSKTNFTLTYSHSFTIVSTSVSLQESGTQIPTTKGYKYFFFFLKNCKQYFSRWKHSFMNSNWMVEYTATFKMILEMVRWKNSVWLSCVHNIICDCSSHLLWSVPNNTELKISVLWALISLYIVEMIQTIWSFLPEFLQVVYQWHQQLEENIEYLR